MLTANELKYYVSLKQKKFREKEKKFLIEGKHLVTECLGSAFTTEVIFIDEKSFDDKPVILLAKEHNVRVERLKTQQINKLSETQTPPGIIGVVRIRQSKTIEIGEMNLIIALDAISDPGNLGTIIRTAYWFGVDHILLGIGSVDINNPKVVRASQGALFHINFTADVNLMNELKFFRTQGFTVYALTTHTRKKLNDTELSRKSIFVFGNESAGLDERLLKAGFENVKIERYSNCESLNVAVSAGVVLEKYRNKEF